MNTASNRYINKISRKIRPCIVILYISDQMIFGFGGSNRYILATEKGIGYVLSGTLFSRFPLILSHFRAFSEKDIPCTYHLQKYKLGVQIGG